MRIHLTPVLYCFSTVLIEVFFCILLSLRDIGKPTSRAEITISSSLYLKAMKGAHLGSALITQFQLSDKYSLKALLL